MADQHLDDLAEYNGAALVGTCIAFLGLSWLAVGLRAYTRAVLIKSLQMDDWLMLVAQIIFTASCAFILQGVNRGMGRHNDAITDHDSKVAALKWQAVATITYILNMMFIKLSIGVFLLRLSVKKVYNYIICLSLAIIVIWSLAIFLWDIFQCIPVEKQWDYRITSGHCAPPSDIIAAAYAISAMTIVSDWLYALIPVPMLWSVKMTTQAKATVIVILGLGVFASIATLVRLRLLDKLQDSEDLLFSTTEVMIWTVTEPGVAIVASSLATIRPLLRAMKIRGFESTDNTHSIASGHVRYTGENRTTPCAARAFGPDDVSLRDVEPGYGPELTEASTKNIGLSFDDEHHSRAVVPTQSDDIKSKDGTGEEYSSAWSTHDDSRTTDLSFEDLSQPRGAESGGCARWSGV